MIYHLIKGIFLLAFYEAYHKLEANKWLATCLDVQQLTEE